MLKVSFQLQDISLALGGAVAGLGPRTTAGYWVMRKRFALNIRIFGHFGLCLQVQNLNIKNLISGQEIGRI